MKDVGGAVSSQQRLENTIMASTDQPQRPAKDHGNPQGDVQPAARSLRSRHKAPWIWLSVIALLGLSAALLSYGLGGTHQTASSGSVAGPAGVGGTATSASAGRAPKGTSKTKGEVTSAAKLAEKGGALNLPTNMNSQLISWQSGSGGKHLTAVSGGLGDALQAAGIRQYAPMKHACAQLAGSVTTAEAGPPIPDAAMQTLYAKALAELAKGAANCQTAISFQPNGNESVAAQVDPTLLHRSVSELSAGATDVFRSTAEMAILARQNH